MHLIETTVLDALHTWRAAPSWCVAFSGGMDSTVLLYALAQLARTHAIPPLRAIYIHHGLQEAAHTWPAHCQYVCDQLQIPLHVIAVDVAADASVEQAARQARYAAFAQHLCADEVLLMAQHQDDQTETLLFRLMRGTGVAGLRGIPVSRALPQGHVVRPLLSVSHQQLLAYAKQHHLAWVEDPSNAADDFDRNYLRHHVVPTLKARWPQMQLNVQRTAQHMDEAQQLLDELAAVDAQYAQFEPVFDWLKLPCLDLNVLRSLSEARQKNVLRFWLTPLTLLPDTTHWAGWVALRDAQVDARPIWRLHSGAVLRYQNQVYWLPESWLQPPPEVHLCVTQAGCYTLPGNGCLQVQGKVAEPLHVRYRQGAERFFIAGRGHRDLKRLLQEYKVPAFARTRIPILYLEQQAVAVANMPALNHPQVQNLVVIWHGFQAENSLSEVYHS